MNSLSIAGNCQRESAAQGAVMIVRGSGQYT